LNSQDGGQASGSTHFFLCVAPITFGVMIAVGTAYFTVRKAPESSFRYPKTLSKTLRTNLQHEPDHGCVTTKRVSAARHGQREEKKHGGDLTGAAPPRRCTKISVGFCPSQYFPRNFLGENYSISRTNNYFKRKKSPENGYLD
jgi:hypothetical protein